MQFFSCSDMINERARRLFMWKKIISAVLFCTSSMLLAMDLVEIEESTSVRRQDCSEEVMLTAHYNGSSNFIIGSLGLIGRHMPNLKAEFIEESVIKCDASAVYFEGLSQLFYPSNKRQLPFFKHFEECANTKAIQASALPFDSLSQHENAFALVKTTDPLEIILHYLTFLYLSESTQDWPYWSLRGSQLERDKIYSYFSSYVRSSECDYNSEEILAIAQDCIKRYVAMRPVPEGGALVPTLIYDVLYCSLEQYKWIRQAAMMFILAIGRDL
jgi:hypothetical protein